MSGVDLKQLQRWAALLGWPGWMGLLMLGMAAALYLAWLPALQAEHEEATTQVEHQRKQLKQLSERLAQADVAKAAGPDAQASTRLPLPESAEQAWALLWPMLPERHQMLARQTAILKWADVQGIKMDNVQFQGAPLKALPQVWRQQVSLPVQAPYAALATWLTQLRSLQGLSIDSLEISRDDVMSDQVKGRVGVSLWMRPDVAVPAVPALAAASASVQASTKPVRARP
jgi:type II secretory pathway component PulM